MHNIPFTPHNISCSLHFIRISRYLILRPFDLVPVTNQLVFVSIDVVIVTNPLILFSIPFIAFPKSLIVVLILCEFSE